MNTTNPVSLKLAHHMRKNNISPTAENVEALFEDFAIDNRTPDLVDDVIATFHSLQTEGVLA